MRVKTAYQLVVPAVCATLIALAAAGPLKSQDKPLDRNPTFKLQDLEGRVNDLADLRGNVVLVSFGATWCAPCTTELRALEELLKEFADKPVKFFWVSIESQEQLTNGDLKRYAKQRKVSFPVLRDSSQAVFLQFSPRVRLPMMVLLAKDGRVDSPVQFGMRSQAEAYKAEIRARLNKLLSVQTETDR
jgi:peroxiredoxin